MENTVTVKFKYHGDLSELFRDYKEMLEFCIDRAIELKTTSFAKLWQSVYENWKVKWYPKYIIQSIPH